MAAPSAQTLLDAWDRGQAVGPAGRAGVLWTLCEQSAEVADPTVGQRDGALLSLRVAVFGDRMDAVACCPSCGETWEMSLSVMELRDDATPGPLRHTAGGYDVRVRPVTQADLVAGHVDVEGLLTRCLLEATRDGDPCSSADLPADVRATVATMIADADPGADIVLHLSCDACGTPWEIPFDPPSYLWAELDVWASRVLREVHALATAYGWTEAEVLALTSHRRRHYLALVGS